MIRALKPTREQKIPACGRTNTRYFDAMTPYFESMLAILASDDSTGCGIPESIGVTSTNPGEGVSTIAFSLAANATNFTDEQITLILTTPVREPVRARFGIEIKPGIADILSGKAMTSECMQEIFDGRIRVLSSGLESYSDVTFDPVRVANLVHQLAAESRLMIVDLPPVSRGGVCLTTVGKLRGVLLTVEANRVGAAEIVSAQSRLQAVGANILGAILNKKA